MNRKIDRKLKGRTETKKENKPESRITLLDWLYPPRCPICDEVLDHPWRNTTRKRMSGGSLTEIRTVQNRRCCPDCEAALPRVKSACMKCGSALADEGQEYCEACMTQRHFFDRGTAAFVYTGALRHSVYRMKAENRRDYIAFYAEEMTRALARFLPLWRPELVVPVPMHPRKQRGRGYNQSELLALEIGKNIGLPVETGLMRCTRIVRSQKELGRKERLKNLWGSFSVSGSLPPVSRVLLVDDVYTTGSTMDEMGRVLREYGVREVYFVVLCTGKGKKAVCTAGKV